MPICYAMICNPMRC
jgi:hypothetical protein